MSKRRLGKGLEAFMPEITALTSPENSPGIKENVVNNAGITEVLLQKIQPNPQQPRKVFDQQKLAELADTIRTYGIIQPITVTREEDYYILVTGERRLKAAEMAGLEKIPAIIKDYSPAEFMEITLVENLQREDLNAIEEALAFKELIEQLNLTQEELAKKIGKSRSAITNSLRLLSLDEQVQDLIADGKITAGQARPLLSIDNHAEQLGIAMKVINNNLSAREIEKLVKQYKRKNKEENMDQYENSDITPVQTPEQMMLIEMEEKARRMYGTRVAIKMGSKGGKIEFTFYNNDDLERLLGLLLKNGNSFGNS